MSAEKAKTMADVRRVIADVIHEESDPQVEREAAGRCAASVLARLKECGVKLVRRAA